MLLLVEVNAIYPAGARDTACIEAVAAQFGRNSLICVGQSRGPLLGAGKLWRYGPLGKRNWRRTYYEDGGHRHARFNWSPSDFVNQRPDSFRRRPCIVERMRERHLANFPVVSRREEKQLLGMITKSDIIMAYRHVAIEAA